MSSLQTLTIEEVQEEFDFLGDWEAQCDYLIDLGFELPEFPEEARTEENRVHGCQSNVWMTARREPATGSPRIHLQADSDAMIVKGLIAILLTLYSGKTAKEIQETDARAMFAKLGLDRHLSTARRNGLGGMVQRVQTFAAEAERPTGRP